MGDSPISEDELRQLLEHEDWIRRLARSLVADENRVNELVQHVMTEALKNKPRNPKPWIAVVMRAAVWRMRRSESRRKFRENAVAREEFQIPGTPQADRSETRDRLVKLVQQLEPVYREVLLQHFFEELTLEEIARRKGVSSATMRTRLRRALAQLREKLRANYGDPSRWVFALLPVSEIHSLREILPKTSTSKAHGIAGSGKTTGSKAFLGAAAAALIAGSAVGVLALGSSMNPEPERSYSGAGMFVVSASGGRIDSAIRDSSSSTAPPAGSAAKALQSAPEAEIVPESVLAEDGIFETQKYGTQEALPGSEAISVDQATGGGGVKSKSLLGSVQPGRLGSGMGQRKGLLGSKREKNSPH